MPAYNFKAQFTPGLLKGLIQLNHEASPPRMDGALEFMAQCWGVDENTQPKRQTIRAHRKRQTKPGETLYLYTGRRTKQCVKLGEAVCKEVKELTLFRYMASRRGVYGKSLAAYLGTGKDVKSVPDIEVFARADGFSSADTMWGWFDHTHGLPFTGELITW